MTDIQTKMERCAAGLLLQALTEQYYKDDAGDKRGLV